VSFGRLFFGRFALGVLILKVFLQASNQRSLHKPLKSIETEESDALLRYSSPARQIWKMASFGARQHCLSQSFAMSSAHFETFTPCYCHCNSARLENVRHASPWNHSEMQAWLPTLRRFYWTLYILGVSFGNFTAPPFPMVWDLLPGTDQRKHCSWWILIYARTMFWNWFMAHAIPCSAICYGWAHHPWNPPAISIWTRCWCFW
jgi:hypothetical protein